MILTLFYATVALTFTSLCANLLPTTRLVLFQSFIAGLPSPAHTRAHAHTLSPISQDLLSLDEATLDATFQYWTPEVRRLPSHVWLRLRGALQGLLVERDGGCLVWYHRQVKEAAFAR